MITEIQNNFLKRAETEDNISIISIIGSTNIRMSRGVLINSINYKKAQKNAKNQCFLLKILKKPSKTGKVRVNCNKKIIKNCKIKSKSERIKLF
jgi:hypothetical protein